jgi:hypothetical protein
LYRENLYGKQKVLAVLTVVMVLAVGIIAVTTTTPGPLTLAPAHFSVASWDFPDDYGQGIAAVIAYENSTGSWVIVDNDGSDYFTYLDDVVLEWSAGVGIKLEFMCYFNYTLTGATSQADGKNYQRHTISVEDQEGSNVFSQTNFTFVYSTQPFGIPLYVYSYSVVCGFLPAEGYYYTATVNYQVWW